MREPQEQQQQPERPPKKKVKFSSQADAAFVVPAAEAVHFHLLLGGSEAELNAELASGGLPFSCEFFHQVFGEEEEIRGYRGLQVHLHIALKSGHCWMSLSADERRAGADDVEGLLRVWWPRPFTTDRAAFIASVCGAPDPDWSSLGTRLPGAIAASSPDASLVLYHAKLADTPGWFKELHERVEPLLIFTIDGANFLETDDPKWEVVAAVATRAGKPYLAGFLCLYNFYAWPLSHRPRVAQVLVLPPLQGGGYGKALVAAAYHLARERDAIDLTFEDPSPSLQLLREKMELEMMAACPWLTGPAHAALDAAAAAAAAAGNGGAAPTANTQQPQLQQENQQPQQQDSQKQPQQPGGAVPQPSKASAAAPSAAKLLAMPPDLQRRATQELKIHKHQVVNVWETLLYLLSPLGAAGSGDDAAAGCAEAVAAPLTELVLSRLERGAAAAVDRTAATKKLVQVEGTDDDWFVCRFRAQPPPAGTAAAAAAGEGDDTAAAAAADEEAVVSVGRRSVSQVSADDYAERLQAAAAQRLETLAVLKQRVLASRAEAAKQQ